MLQECLDGISKVVGRYVSNEEGEAMLDDVRMRMAELRKSDPKYKSLSFDQQVIEAAKIIAAEKKQKAVRNKTLMIKQMLKQNENLRKLDRLQKEEDLHAFKAVGKIMVDIDFEAKGVANDYLSDMLDTMNGLGSKWFGMIEDTEDVRAFIYEAYGIDSGSERAKVAWKAWERTAESMRVRVNNLGGDVGKLDYGYIPQSHDSWKLLKAAKILKRQGVSDQDAWVDFIWDKLDRSQYIDEYGKPFDDDRYRLMLSEIYDRIRTNGSTEDDVFKIAEDRPKKLASRKKFPSRKLHFKTADDWLEYESKFAKGSLSTSLIQHVQRMSNNIALMEAWGPQPQATFDLLKYEAQEISNNAIKMLQVGNDKQGLARQWQEVKNALDLNFHYKDSQGVFVSLDDVWSTLNGEAYHVTPTNARFANIMQGWRNLEVAGKLGKTFITSFSDIPTYFIATGFNRLGFADSVKYLGRAYGREWKDYAARMGLMAESMISDFNRWAGDNIGENWTGKVANATMRASLLQAFTDGNRRAFALNMTASFAKMIKKPWEDLDAYDRARLTDGGIAKDDWQIYQATGVVKFKGIEFLNIKGIRYAEGFDEAVKQRAQGKILGFIVKESEMASLNPDLIVRASTTRGLKKGTMGGELSRALFLFKSFPVGMMKQHFERAQFLKRHGGKYDRMAYLSALITGTTMFGALSLQVQNVLNGKDLQDMETREFWLNAFTKGGGLGFLGDFIANQLSENARYGAWSTVSFLGPQASTALEVTDTITKATGAALYDKDTKPAASALHIARSHMPFINMWYTQTAIDRYLLNDLQEYLSPGYLSRMERRTQRSWGQGYWWGLREAVPSRTPQIADQPE